MATKLSELPTVTSISSDDLVPIVKDGTTSKITMSNLFSGIPLGRSLILTHDNDEETLTTDIDIYYIDIVDYNSFSVTLPDASTMINRSLIFCTRETIYETWFTINGPIRDGSSFNLMGPSSVTLLCDGTTWWVTSKYGN